MPKLILCAHFAQNVGSKVAAGLAILFCMDAFAFNTTGGGFNCCKWDDPTLGTGATITWSFMTPGVPLAPIQPLIDTGWTGTNSLGSGSGSTDIRVKMDFLYGSGAFDAAVHRAFAVWSAAANVTFVKVPDSGAAMGAFAPGSTQPDIRIGSFAFAPGDLAGGAGFGPPGSDLFFPDPLAGDLALNDQNRFVVTQGTEGSPIPTDNGVYLNDLEGLLIHEIGHTLGLAHSDVPAGIMCGYIFPGTVFDGSLCDYTHINHVLDPDDVAGIRSLYGAAIPPAQPIPLPPLALAGLALALAATALVRGRRSRLPS